MSTLFFYLLRIKILGSFKSPINSTTLDLSGHQPLHQRHSGPSCIISGLDYGKRPQTDVSASAAAQPLPSNVYSPSSRQSDHFKRQIWLYSLSLQRAESHSEWKPKSWQRPTGLTQSDFRFQLVSYFISTTLTLLTAKLASRLSSNMSIHSCLEHPSRRRCVDDPLISFSSWA